MSESPAEAAHADVAAEPLFDKAELAEFAADDTLAGRHICKMLALLFIYTVIAMSICTALTHFKIMD
jgi:hypothetical protein